MDITPGEQVMTTCKQPKPSSILQSTSPVHQRLKPLAHSPSRLKTTELPLNSPIQMTLAMRQELKSLADQPLEGMAQPNSSKRGLTKGYLYLLQKSIQSKSSGFTIIECLLAIIMVGIMLTAVAPVIVLSVATRVQARRVEQATIAGRNYVDAVQSGTIPLPANTVALSEADPTTKTYLGSDRATFAKVAAPPSTPINCPDDRATAGATSIYPYCGINNINRPNQPSLYCVDNDGGGCTSSSNKDYIVQAFRSVKATAPNTRDPADDGSGGYVLGVRVYRADGFDGATPLQTTRENNGKKVATYTGGKGNQFAPLAEFTTEVRPSAGLKPGVAMTNLCDRLGGCTNPTTAPTP